MGMSIQLAAAVQSMLGVTMLGGGFLNLPGHR